jgi:hypothetical protein
MIVAIQYYEDDRERTLQLVRLLTDLEKAPRNDILLALVCQPSTPMTDLTEKTLEYAANRFPVTHVVSTRGAHKPPEACGQLWAGTMEHFSRLFEDGNAPHSSIFTVDGNDGIPLHRDWIDLIKKEHERTLSSGRLVSGTPNALGVPLHINPNMISHLSLWKKCPCLSIIPRYDGTFHSSFDIFHRMTILKYASPSSIVCHEWHGYGRSISPETLRKCSKKSAWLHGYKDEALYSVARRHLLASDMPPMKIERHDLDRFISLPGN